MAIKSVGVTGGGNMMMNASSPVEKKLSKEESDFIEHGGEIKTIKLTPEELEKELQRVGFYKKKFNYIPSKKEQAKQEEDEENYEKEKYEEDNKEENEDEISLNEMQEEYESQFEEEAMG